MAHAPGIYSVGQASQALAEFERLHKSRSLPEKMRKQKNFGALVLHACGADAEEALDIGSIQTRIGQAIVLAFLLGLHYQEAE